MKDTVLLSYIILDIIVLLTGILILVFGLSVKSEISRPSTLDTVARNLILNTFPVNATIANAIMIFIIFLFTLPAIAIPKAREWLKLTGYMTVISGIFTMTLGLVLWFQTLRTRKNLLDIWDVQDVSVQSLLQTKFNCCGYLNSTSPPFVADNVCPNPVVAAARLGCVFRFSSFANSFLDVIFTSAFGIVGIDTMFVLATTILLKNRKEKARYHVIMEKNFKTGI